MNRAIRRGLLTLVGAMLVACSVGNQIIAGRGEYELYRNTHLAFTLEARLEAGNRYLKNDPEGRYAEEIKDWFEPAEKAYVGAAWNSLPRLRAYLKAMPDGPNAERVKARAEELEATIGFAEKREQRSKAHVDEIQANLERAAEQRKAFVDDVSAWIRSFAAVRSWDKPPAELDPAIVSRFGGVKLGDACVGDLCSKAFTPRFAIPVKEKIVPREAAYSVELVLLNGAAIEARVRGRELFSRLAEALDRRAVSFADPQSRAEGIGRALGLVTNALGNSFSGESCEHPAVSPVVLERACGGTRVVATAALSTGDDDLVVFGREVAPVEPPKTPPAKGPPGKAAPPAPKTPALPKAATSATPPSAKPNAPASPGALTPPTAPAPSGATPPKKPAP